MDELFVKLDTDLDILRLRFWTAVLNLGKEIQKVATTYGDKAAHDLEVDRERLRRVGA